MIKLLGIKLKDSTFFILIAIFALFTIMSHPANAGGVALYNPLTGEYLGQYSANKYAPDSTSNQYGTYGSQYSSKSINNPYGQYGSVYSNTSPHNPYATSAPVQRSHGHQSEFYQYYAVP